MTLRRNSRGDSIILNALIRVALRESVGRAEPPPRAWERIEARLAEPITTPARLWQVCRAVCENVAIWWHKGALSTIQSAYYRTEQNGEIVWREDRLYLLMYQYELPMLLARTT